jgi:ABC-2 type transport system ATP-binding protein
MRTITAVDELDLVVPEGAAFGLLGPNGAGKTTTIQMVLGLVRPTSGSSEVFGRRIDSHAARRLVGFVPEKFQLPRAWTAREYVELHAALHGLRGAEKRRAVDEVLERTGIGGRADDRLGGFSKGMQQRAAIAQALVGRPRLLILDEPTSALDPLGRLQVRELVRELHADGATIVFNSHILGEVEAICDQVAIMHRGRVLRQGSVAELASAPTDERLHDATLRLPAGASLDDVRGALGAAGVDVLDLTPRREGLEELFVRLVDHADDEEAAA